MKALKLRAQSRLISFYVLIMLSLGCLAQGAWMVYDAYDKVGTYIPKNCSEICDTSLPGKYKFEFPMNSLFFFVAGLLFAICAFKIKKEPEGSFKN